jgi:hypothetical protein
VKYIFAIAFVVALAVTWPKLARELRIVKAQFAPRVSTADMTPVEREELAACRRCASCADAAASGRVNKIKGGMLDFSADPDCWDRDIVIYGKTCEELLERSPQFLPCAHLGAPVEV